MKDKKAREQLRELNSKTAWIDEVGTPERTDIFGDRREPTGLFKEVEDIRNYLGIEYAKPNDTTKLVKKRGKK